LTVTLKLPIYHVFLGTQEKWFTTREQLDAFRNQQEEKAGGQDQDKSNLDQGPAGTPVTPQKNSTQQQNDWADGPPKFSQGPW
jgi:hypothetical protein